MKDSARSMVPKPNPGIDDSSSSTVVGQFLNMRRHFKKSVWDTVPIERPGVLGVEKPTNRGKRYSDDFTGDKGSSK